MLEQVSLLRKFCNHGSIQLYSKRPRQATSSEADSLSKSHGMAKTGHKSLAAGEDQNFNTFTNAPLAFMT